MASREIVASVCMSTAVLIHRSDRHCLYDQTVDRWTGHGRHQHSAPDSGQVEKCLERELNSWKRGFTPQAEIWNGRLAMLGLSVGLAVLLIVRLVSGGLS